MKDQLAEEIGWFNSKNSLAHITINEFMASEKQIEFIKKELILICDSIKPVAVSLKTFGTYPNGAFFLAPDEITKPELKSILQYVNQAFNTNTRFKNSEPHLSIARKLSPEKIEKAYRLFPSAVALNFICDSITLRCYNPDVKQFEIVSSFSFNNNPDSFYGQGTLF
ncbi:2'-5' RNA ligase family protein [Flavobacterium sp. ARAG 55.4]|uniref:2'-5' RNA ligase family protein n=1 Tax=Flavobacterium sp. ARAG 55.4 TaxID=3451357 RepID=UPI003F485497